MKSMQNRREFLKTGLAGLAGAAALTGRDLTAGQAKPDEEKTAEAEPVRRTLGKTGLRVPVVSMGTGDTQDPGLIGAALDAGMVLLATSQYYGNGQNEQIIGRVLKGRARDSVLVMTSAMPDGYDFKAATWTGATKAGPFLEKFEGSLKRLETDCVDIFLLPFAARRESVLFEPLLKAMEQIKRQGKARFIGIATHQFEPEAIRAAVETGVYDVAMTAYNFRKENRAEIEQAAEEASKAGLGIIAMKTMAGAFWDKERTRPINAGAALKWALRKECIHTAVPGMTTFDQLSANRSVMRHPVLSDPEKEELKLTSVPDPLGPFCQQCGRCVPQCPKGQDIPNAMRAYMYAVGYGDTGRAGETLSMAGIRRPACGECRSCSVRCALGADIRNKMLDLERRCRS
jgi:predicted aldo/keto reductase-like oxidoreductase